MKRITRLLSVLTLIVLMATAITPAANAAIGVKTYGELSHKEIHGDGNAINDGSVLDEDFEGEVFPPQGWTLESQSQDTWRRYGIVYPGTTDVADYVIACAYSDTQEQDEWLHVDELDMTSAQDPYLHFWFYAENYYSWVYEMYNLQIFLSHSDGVSVEVFNLWDESFEDYTWTQAQIEIPAEFLNRNDVRLSINYSGFDGVEVLMDDIKIGDLPNGEFPEIPDVWLYGYHCFSSNLYNMFLGFAYLYPGEPDYIEQLSNNIDDDNVTAGEYVNGTIYAYTDDFAGGYNFITVDGQTYERTHVAQVDFYTADMTFNYPERTFYAITAGDDEQISSLSRIDLTDGSRTNIGTPQYNGEYVDLATLAANIHGQMYAIGFDANLYLIDSQTAQLQLIGPTGVSQVAYAQSMCFDNLTGSDTLFWARCSSNEGDLRIVDVQNGYAWNLGTLGDNAEMTALYIPTQYDLTPVYPQGDVNLDGILNAGDVSALLRYCVELFDITPEGLALADVNGDLEVNTGDAAYLLNLLMQEGIG